MKFKLQKLVLFCSISISLEIIMEIMPSKFRSPPPKPPRRRHSEQLTISPSGTYPTTRKKYHEENKLGIKEALTNIENNTGCESLPANWIAEFSSDEQIENPLSENSPHFSTSHPRKIQGNFQPPVNSGRIKYSNEFIEKVKEEPKTFVSLEWARKSNNSYLERFVSSNRFLSNSGKKSLLGHFNHDSESELKSASTHITNKNHKLFELKSFPKEYHRRHHSDPVLPCVDGSNSKTPLQRYSQRAHSFLGNSSIDNNKQLFNSLTTFSGSKENQHLHEELEILKDINNKLWQKLCSMQASLEKLKKKPEENDTSLSVSDLLSSLYYSQKAKDSAMEDRMKILLEERDSAIQELEDLIQIIARSFEDDTIPEEEFSDKAIKELLREIEVTSNPTKLLQQQRLLLTYLYHSKELKQDHIIHELKLAVSERDHFLEKVKYLEEELESLKLCNEIWNTDNKHWENHLLDILSQVIQQRDVALSKIHVTQNSEQKNCRAIHENSELLVKDHEIHPRQDDVNLCAVKRSLHLQSSCESPNCDQFLLESVSDEMRLKGEILVLRKALEMEVGKREIAEEKCLRLERLVNVLQTKVNGQNIGISV